MSVRAVAKKELRQMRRDPRTLAILIFVPSLLLVLFGFVLSFDVRHIPFVLVDQDGSPHSRSFVDALVNNEYFEVVERAGSAALAIEALDRGAATMVLVVPPGFGEELEGGGKPAVQAIVDGCNANAAQTALAYLTAFARSRGAALAASTGAAIAPPLEARPTVLYNPELRSERFLVPGLIAFLTMVTCAIATALSVVRERETGTMEQMLVSPLNPLQIIVGKSLPYAVVSIVATALVLLTGVTLFGVEIRGSLFWLSVSTLVFILGAQGLGLLISAATRSQQVAFMVAMLVTLLPTFLLSGFAFPIRSMPFAIQLVTYVVPARYFLVVLRGVILRGTGPESFWPDLAALTAFTLLVTVVAVARLRKVRL